MTREELQATAAEIRKATREAQGLSPELTDDSVFHLVAGLMRQDQEADRGAA